MIRRYHGTNAISAATIVGPPSNINLSLGGGELGVGFYVGVSVALCAARAKSKYNVNSAMIEFTIDSTNYNALNILKIKSRYRVYNLWRKLNRIGQRNIYVFNYDIIRAPYAVIYHSFQEKFETLQSKLTLENSTKTII